MNEHNEEHVKREITGANIKKPSIVKELADYAIKEVIEPKTKDIMNSMLTSVIGMFSDAATKVVERRIYPEGVPHKATQNKNGVYVSHTDYTKSSKNNTTTYQSRSSINVNYIWVDTKEQARDIISGLKEEIDNYGKAKVAILYEWLTDENGNKIPTQFTDFKYGWTKDHLSQIGYYQETTGEHRGQFFIDLPKPVNIENI